MRCAVKKIRAGLRAWLGRRVAERQLDKELRYHLDEQIEANVAAGMPPEEARRRALLAFGGAERFKQECRDARPWRLFADLAQDARYGLRQLRRAPGFTAIAVLTLALGIGANTAIFTLLDQVLLRLLPVKDPHELVLVTSRGAQYGNAWGDGDELSYPMYADLRDHNAVFSGMLCRFSIGLHVGVDGRTEPVSAEFVSGTYFPVLGVGAARGRIIDPGDDRAAGAHPVVVLSHRYWRSRFPPDAEVIGKKIMVNNHPMTIIGVAREGFDGMNQGAATQVYVPIAMFPQVGPIREGLTSRRWRWLNVFGRLRPGVTAEQAQASLQPFYTSRLQMEVEEPAFSRASDVEKARFLRNAIEVTPAGHGKSELRRALTGPLLILMAVVVSLLLIACANLANLLLARAAARRREFAVRLALGAGRWRLVRQLLVESLLLAAFGGFAGLLIAMWGAQALLGFLPDARTLTVTAAPDLRILAFTCAVTVLTGVLFGLAPAWRSTRPDLAPTLKDEAGSLLGGGHARLRKALVVSQLALSLVLLVGAGLFLRSLHNLLKEDPGFEVTRLLSFGLDLGSAQGYDAARGKQFAKTLLERVQATPGVVAAGFTSHRLLEGGSWNNFMTVEGRPYNPDDRVKSHNHMISPGYFKALGIPLVAGRDFGFRDERMGTLAEPPEPPRAAIANERFVELYLKGGPVLGRRVGFGRDPGTPTPIEIVGVVKNARYTSLRDDAQPQLYFPYLEGAGWGFTMYVRTGQEPEAMIETLRRVVGQLDASLPIGGVRTMEEQLERSLTRERLVASLAAGFGLLATLLAMIGLYGVMAYTVARRTREIGIRMALGARSGNIAWLVMREVVVVVAVGISIALPALWIANRFLRSLLYEVSPTDPATVVFASGLLAAVAALAGLLPARRAARVDPMVALRCE